MRRLLILAVVFAAGCDRCDLTPVTHIPDATDQIDVFDQKKAAEVDVLWMVDNSPSMASHQKNLAAKFNEFFHELLVSEVDYHIGVVDADIGEKGVLHEYTGPDVTGCAGCRFATKDIPCPNPGVDISGLTDEASIDAKLATDCPAELVFRNLVQTGSNGPSFEQEFAVVSTALGVFDIDPATGLPKEDPPAENAGFIRPEASLYIVFVSDEDEGAKNDAPPVRYFQRLYESLKGAGNENKVAVAAITGYANDDESLVPLADVCDVLATTYDGDVSNDDPRAAQLISQLHNHTDGCTSEDAQPDDPNAFAEPGYRYIDLACRTGGVVANICKSDYSTALDALGANAAGLLRKYTLSLQSPQIDWGLDCKPFTSDDINLDCDNDGKKDGPLDGPICVTALGITGQCETGTAPHLIAPATQVGSNPHAKIDGTCGWTYEAGTNSIRFDGGFVPAPGSKVQIRYLKAAANQKCGG